MIIELKSILVLIYDPNNNLIININERDCVIFENIYFGCDCSYCVRGILMLESIDARLFYTLLVII